MKKIGSILFSLVLLILMFSCSFSYTANTISLKLPSFIGVANSDNNFPNKEDYTFEITLKNSSSVMVKRNVKFGDDVVFTNVPIGSASISVIVYKENIVWYSGETSFVVKKGKNEVKVSLKKIAKDDNNKPDDGNKPDSGNDPANTITVTVKINGESYTYDSESEEFTSDNFESFISFVKEKANLPEKSIKQILIFNENNKKIDYTDSKIIEEIVSNINEGNNKTFNAKIAVGISKYDDYLSSEEIQENETIYFYQDDSDITEIPEKPDSKSSKATGLILDFSDCKSLTTISKSAFIDASDKWVSVLKLPASIELIYGIKAVKDAVYMPLPDGNLQFGSGSSCNVSFSQSDANSGKYSTYDFHFGGTLADWCGRVVPLSSTKHSLSTSADAHPFYNKNYGKDLYFVDSNGNEYCTTGKDLIIENEYTKADGSKEVLSAIPENAFRWMKCESISFSDSVESIGATAMVYCSAHTIYIGSGVTEIASGALFYDLENTVIGDSENGERTIKYNGTVDDWMKIKTSANTSSAEGGPLRGTSNFYIKENGKSEYSNAVQDGYLKVTLDPTHNYAKEISGQLQGFKGEFKLKILGTPDESTGYFNIANYAFNNCSNLLEIDSEPALKIGQRVFEKCSNLKKVILRSSTKTTMNETSTYHSFYGLSGINFMVYPDLAKSECDGYISNLTDCEITAISSGN